MSSGSNVLMVVCFSGFFSAALRHCEEERRSNPVFKLPFWIASFLAMTTSVANYFQFLYGFFINMELKYLGSPVTSSPSHAGLSKGSFSSVSSTSATMRPSLSP